MPGARHARNKGKTGERELVRLLRDELGDVVHRPSMNQWRDKSAPEITIQTKQKNKTHILFQIECKRRSNWPVGLPGFWRQSVEASKLLGADVVPVLAGRGDGQSWQIVMDYNDVHNLVMLSPDVAPALSREISRRYPELVAMSLADFAQLARLAL